MKEIRGEELVGHELDREQNGLGSPLACFARRVVGSSERVDTQGNTQYVGDMCPTVVSGQLEEVAPLVIHAVVSGIFNEKQSFAEVYELAESLPHMLKERLDVESAVEALHKLYYIMWTDTESFQDAESFHYPADTDRESKRNQWKRLFDTEDGWFELAAHVQCMEKQLWKWEHREVAALFDAYFAEDTAMDYSHGTGYRGSVKTSAYFCLDEAIGRIRVDTTNIDFRMDGTRRGRHTCEPAVEPRRPGARVGTEDCTECRDERLECTFIQRLGRFSERLDDRLTTRIFTKT